MSDSVLSSLRSTASPQDYNHYLTNVSNYSGIYQTGVGYKKFDFIYNTGDGLFYYAREDLTYGGGVSVAESNRFSLGKDGAISPGGGTISSQGFYIYDEYNRIGKTIGENFKVGQTITVAGSTGTNDGTYKILAINYDINEIATNATGSVTGALDATPRSAHSSDSSVYADRWDSSWFFNTQNSDSAKALDDRSFYMSRQEVYDSYIDYYPDLTTAYNLSRDNGDTREKYTWGEYHWVYSGQAQGRLLPKAGGRDVLFEDTLGWTWVQPSHDTKQEAWFFCQTSDTYAGDNPSGIWLWASSGTMGPDSVSNSAYMHIEESGNGILGPTGWTYWQGDTSRPQKINVYNYDEDQWYLFNGHGGGSKLANSEKISAPSSPPSVSAEARVEFDNKPTTELSLPLRSRVWVAPANGSSSIDTDEPASSNTLTISTLDADPSTNPNSWSNHLFFFDADYGSSVDFKANNLRRDYGNGYYTVQPRNINSLTAEFNLKFMNRTSRESNAIIHFLENHQGQHDIDRSSPNLKYKVGISGFRWDGNSTFHPYDSPDMQSKTFYCSDFTHSLNFENSNDLKVKLRNLDTSLLNKSEQLYINAASPPNAASSTATYDNSKLYEKNDIAFYTGNRQFYYWHSDTSTNGKPPAEPNSSWHANSGYYTDINTGYWCRDFFWLPSLGLEVSQNPRLNEMNMGGAYSQLYEDGINESLLKLDLKFENRTDEEAHAILHFLENHYGCIPFNFSPPAPYNKVSNFICEQWTHTYVYKDCHTIAASFEQYPFAFSAREYSDIVPPPELSSGELILPQTIHYATDDGVNKISIGESVRKRVRLKNIGDDSLQIYSGAAEQHSTLGTNAEEFVILGQTGFNSQYPIGNLPVIDDTKFSYDQFVVEIPSIGMPFDLDGKLVRISKKYSEGAVEGGVFFTKVEWNGSRYVNVNSSAHPAYRDVYFQNNKGFIVSGVEHDASQILPCNYFVNEPLFNTGNALSSLAGGQEGYVDIVFSGISQGSVEFTMSAEPEFPGDSVGDPSEGYDIMFSAVDQPYYGQFIVDSSTDRGRITGMLYMFLSSNRF